MIELHPPILIDHISVENSISIYCFQSMQIDSIGELSLRTQPSGGLTYCFDSVDVAHSTPAVAISRTC